MAYNDRCQYCENEPAPQIDHIVPISKGGEDVLENMVPACERCNKKKSDLMLKPLYIGILISRAELKVETIKKLYNREKLEKGSFT